MHAYVWFSFPHLFALNIRLILVTAKRCSYKEYVDLIRQLGKKDRSDNVSLKLLHKSVMLYGVLNYYVTSVKRLLILSFKQHGWIFNNQELYNCRGRPHKDSKFSFQDTLIKSQVQKVSITKQTGRILAGNTKLYDTNTRDEPILL